MLLEERGWIKTRDGYEKSYPSGKAVVQLAESGYNVFAGGFANHFEHLCDAVMAADIMEAKGRLREKHIDG